MLVASRFARSYSPLLLGFACGCVIWIAFHWNVDPVMNLCRSNDFGREPQRAGQPRWHSCGGTFQLCNDLSVATVEGHVCMMVQDFLVLAKDFLEILHEEDDDKDSDEDDDDESGEEEEEE
jgi:hypothetical protein